MHSPTRLLRSTLPTLLALAFLGASTQALADQDCFNCQSWTCDTVTLTIEVPNQPVQTLTNVPYIKGMNVRLAFYNAAALANVSFGSTNFCPFGGFVTTINGYTPTGNDYWSLSINGKVSDTGMDTTLLKPNDRITWSVKTYTGTHALTATSAAKASKSQQESLFLLHLQKAQGKK